MTEPIDAQIVDYAEAFLDDLERDQPSVMREAQERAADLGITCLSNQSS